MTTANNAAFIWSIANLLRGPYKPAEYGPVILPFTVLRRLDCVLEPTKQKVLDRHATMANSKVPEEIVLPTIAGQSFYNTSAYDLAKLGGDPAGTRLNLINYINGFSPNVRDIFERFGFLLEIDKLVEHEMLYMVTKQFASVDLHPKVISNIEMGLMFEELIRKFAESSNETAGEHFTPREVIRLMVSLLFANDDDALAAGGVVRSVYDPTAGTGGMLSVSDEHLRALNPKAKLVMYGQEINPASYAICKADMVIKGQDVNNIIRGDTLTDDGHHGKTFDYCLSNPPFGVEWKKAEKKVRDEHTLQGYNGRFGPGLPRVSDGSLLFLLHELALAEKGVLKLTDPERAKLTAALSSMDAMQVWKDRSAFRKALINAMTAQQLIAPTPVAKTLVDALSERDDTAPPCQDSKGRIEPDTELRDTENVPLTDDVQTYFEREVLPHVPDAWIDHTKTKIGYEIPFTRHFYKYVPPRELEEIDADLNILIGEIQALLKQVEA
jgi:hypothetical protein